MIRRPTGGSPPAFRAYTASEANSEPKIGAGFLAIAVKPALIAAAFRVQIAPVPEGRISAWQHLHFGNALLPTRLIDLQSVLAISRRSLAYKR